MHARCKIVLSACCVYAIVLQNTKQLLAVYNGSWRADYLCTSPVGKIDSGLTVVQLTILERGTVGQGSKRQPPLNRLDGSFFVVVCPYLLFLIIYIEPLNCFT